MNEHSIYRVEGLSQSYAKGFLGVNQIFDDFSVEFEKGKIYALFGRNGAGKTTLLNCMLGLVSFKKGDMYYKNELITSRNVHRIMQNITSIPNSFEMYKSLTPNRYIKHYKGMYDRWDDELEQRIKKITDFDWDAPFHDHSTGQKMQIIQLLSLCPSPELLILDEPLGVTDPVIRKYFYKTLISMVAEKETTIVIATHLINEIENLFDTAIFLKYGKITLTETMENINSAFRKFVLESMPDMKVDGELGRLLGEKALISNDVEKTDRALKSIGIRFNIEIPALEDIFEIYA